MSALKKTEFGEKIKQFILYLNDRGFFWSPLTIFCILVCWGGVKETIGSIDALNNGKVIFAEVTYLPSYCRSKGRNAMRVAYNGKPHSVWLSKQDCLSGRYELGLWIAVKYSERYNCFVNPVYERQVRVLSWLLMPISAILLLVCIFVLIAHVANLFTKKNYFY